MNCKHCNSTWESEISTLNCPFCDTALPGEDAIKMIAIIDKCTDYIYQSPADFVNIIKQYYGDAETAKLLEILVSYDVPQKICELKNQEKYTQEYNQILDETSHLSFIDTDVLKTGMEILLTGIGLKSPKLESQTQVNEFTTFLTKYSGQGELVIPEVVTNINEDVFKNCDRLTEITVCGNVKIILQNQFFQCHNLNKVILKEGVEIIGVNAFSGCNNLTSVAIPKSVETIEDNAFSNCRSLSEITIEEGVYLVGNGVFNNCSSLNEIVIPNSLESISQLAFSGCINLNKITLPYTLTEIRENAFSDCENLCDIVIPNTVVFIGNNAFSNCSKLPQEVVEQILSINPNAINLN